MKTRRNFVTGAGALAGWGLAGAGVARAVGGLPDTFTADMARLELENGGRLGVAVQDTGSGARAGHRDGERFPMCSTFKLLAAAAVLKRVDGGNERLDPRIGFVWSGPPGNSPITQGDVGAAAPELAGPVAA